MTQAERRRQIEETMRMMRANAEELYDEEIIMLEQLEGLAWLFARAEKKEARSRGKQQKAQALRLRAA